MVIRLALACCVALAGCGVEAGRHGEEKDPAKAGPPGRVGVSLLKFPNQVKLSNDTTTNLRRCAVIIDDAITGRFERFDAGQKVTLSRLRFEPLVEGDEFYRRAVIASRLECDTEDGKPIQVKFTNDP